MQYKHGIITLNVNYKSADIFGLKRTLNALCTEQECKRILSFKHWDRKLLNVIAAKLALFKAVGIKITALNDFRNVEVAHDSLGAPKLRMDHSISAACEFQINRCLLTISDTKKHVVAYVCAICK